MAMAPQAKLVLAKFVGSTSNASISERQLVAPSSDRKTPPLADAAYRICPPGTTARPETRPPMGWSPTVWPFRTTLGPSGSQFFAPGTTAAGGAAASARAGLGAAAAFRSLYSLSSSSQAVELTWASTVSLFPG